MCIYMHKKVHITGGACNKMKTTKFVEVNQFLKGHIIKVFDIGLMTLCVPKFI